MEVDFKLIPKYLNKMGIIQGTLLFIKVELLKKNKFYFNQVKQFVSLRSNSSDIKVFREVFLFEDYAINLTKKPTVIIDGGGNIGLSDIYFSVKFPNAKIIVVEPDLENFDALKINVNENSNIIPLHSALWCKSTYLRIINSEDDEWTFQVNECDKEAKGAFWAFSIYDLMNKYGLEHIDLLKLDVEGSEKEIFEYNYEQWLSKTDAIIIELHDWIKKGVSRSVFKTISLFNFKTIVRGGLITFEKEVFTP